MLIHNAVLTGSFSYAGADLSNISASADYSASLSTRTTNLETASGSFSTRLTAVSSSQQQISSSQQQISASLLNVIATGATTGSNSFRADQSITGSLVVSSTITAQTLVVQTVTSSIVYSSGSNNFGNQSANTQTFTGSVNITGSTNITGNINLVSSTGFPTVGLLNRSSDTTLYMVSPSNGFTLTDSSLNTIYNATPTVHNWNIGNSLKMKLDASGSLGLGVTPSGWISTAKAFQLGNTAALYAPSSEAILSNNVFVDSTDNNKYITTNFASQYRQVNGQHIFYSADSGTAGNTISFGSAKLTIAASGASTFSSSVTATQFNVSTSGGTTQIYNTGGGHTVITNATANKDINYQTSGTGGHYLNTAGADRLIISSTGTAQFNSEDISGNRTTLNNVLTITQTNPNAPYSGFGSGILFRGTTYNGGGSGIPATRSWGRIGMQITDSSFGTTGENMIFEVAAADNSDTLTTALTLAYNSTATFSSTITATGATIASDVVGDPVYLRVRNNNTGGYPSSLALSLYGYSGTAAYFDALRIQASYPGYGSANFFVKYQSTSADVNAISIRGDGFITFNSTSDAISINHSVADKRSIAIHKTSGDVADYYIVCDNIVANKFLVNGAGTIYAVNTTVQSASDIRFKENIRDLETGLSEILSLKPRRFDWKEGKGMDIKNAIGFIAQEVEEILPDLVKDDWVNSSTDSTSYKSLGMTNMIPTLVKAIQELQAQITELKNK